MDGHAQPPAGPAGSRPRLWPVGPPCRCPLPLARVCVCARGKSGCWLKRDGEEAALRKHGREGFLLRSRACAGLLFAFFYSLLSHISFPSYQRNGESVCARVFGRRRGVRADAIARSPIAILLLS